MGRRHKGLSRIAAAHRFGGEYEFPLTKSLTCNTLNDINEAKYGVVLLKSGRASEATIYWEKSILLAPKMADSYFQPGKAFSDEGQFEQAEKSWLKVIQLEPATRITAPTHYQLAQPYQKQERNQEAEKELELFRKLQGSLQRGKAGA
jgi:tetratricopeptide (TPR) repeat protein